MLPSSRSKRVRE